jgi:UDP-N-acetylmuramate dehydrogenase
MNDTVLSSIFRDIAPFAHCEQNADMRNYTTFKTGGPADLLAYPNSPEDTAAIIRYAKERSIPCTVIGGGSNLVIGDKGLRGIVIRMAEDTIRKGLIEERGEGLVYVDSIVLKRDLIDFAVMKGYSGSEFMAGIPGCIGGGIHMNAGTFMGTFIDILDRVVYIDTNGEIRELKLTRDMAHYRSIDIINTAVIWGGYFSFREKRPVATLRAAIDEIIADRKVKHPQDPSAGSVFKNPEGHASWKLIDDAGLKGYRIGGAMVSTLHTNFIINAGGATSRDIRDCINHVKDTVREKFGIDLHTEVRLVGEF